MKQAGIGTITLASVAAAFFGCSTAHDDCHNLLTCPEYAAGGAGPTSGVGGSGGANTGGANTGGANTGGGCSAGETRPCYDGPAATQGVGACQSGVATCQPDGVFGACQGQVLPAESDDCATAADDDCDGVPNDGCSCTPGEEQSCYSGPPGTQGVGPCVAGKQVCSPEGKFGVCAGEVVPKPEDCATAVDEDCNGKSFDDAAAGCVCAPGATAACDTGLLGVCAAGIKTCGPDGTSFSACAQTTPPSDDDCATPEDEDCDGTAAACTGDPIGGKAITPTPLDDAAYGVAVDADGNFLVVGVGYGALNSGYGVNTGTAAVLKLDPKGNILWAKTYAPAAGFNAYTVARGVAVDANKNIAVVGEFRGAVDFGNGTVNSNGVDAFLLRLDSNGNTLWSKTFGDNSDQVAYGVAVGKNNEIVITGAMSGSMNFGVGGGGTLFAQGGADVFVARFSMGGLVSWAKRFGDGKDQRGTGLAFTPDGDLVLVGEMEGTVNFGGGSLSAVGNKDALIVKLDGATGGHVWSERAGSAGEQGVAGVAVDAQGRIAIAGSFQNQLDFKGMPLVSSGNDDLFAAQLAGDGSVLWARSFGDAQEQTATAVTVDAAGDVVFVGNFRGNVSFGATTLSNGTASTDLLVAKLHGTDGAPLWARRFGDAQPQYAWGVAADKQGTSSVVGGFAGAISLGAAGNLASTGGSDAFLLFLAP